jgi:hypothetical protein
MKIPIFWDVMLCSHRPTRRYVEQNGINGTYQMLHVVSKSNREGLVTVITSGSDSDSQPLQSYGPLYVHNPVLNFFEVPELSVGCIPLTYRQRNTVTSSSGKEYLRADWDSRGQLPDLKDDGSINLLCVHVGIRAVWSGSLGVQFYLRMLQESSLDQQRISYLLTPEQVRNR